MEEPFSFPGGLRNELRTLTEGINVSADTIIFFNILHLRIEKGAVSGPSRGRLYWRTIMAG